jgi:diguanylate cyclase (GGDEF)-like protein
MIAVGFLVFRLIGDSQQGKTDARANGVLSAATSLYDSESAIGSSDAKAIARELSARLGNRVPSPGLVDANLASLAAQSGLARVTVSLHSRLVADVGSRAAVAPGSAIVAARGMVVVASEVTAAEYVRDLAARGAVLLIRQGPRVLASSQPSVTSRAVPVQGSVRIGGTSYRALSQALPGFGGGPVTVTALSSVSATSGSTVGSRLLAVAFIVAFLILALSFSVLASRGLQGQVSRFLQAARRLAGGDFSSPIKIEGRDEFAALGGEFNNMSTQLAQRLDELSQERARLREAIRRIGQSFASNLDRPALLELALKTAVDAVSAQGGRISARSTAHEPLVEALREGSMGDVEVPMYEAERLALDAGELSEASGERNYAASVPLAQAETGGRNHGLLTVARSDEPFSEADRELLRSLAAQATLALENVDLHLQVSRQAVTDELTGLSNHRRFQELLGSEIEQLRRYHYPLGLIMLDIDNFKSVNDTYGHQQGDVVLSRVAQVVADNSREVDYPARYGGEELALILPHTDLEGAYAIAERIRTAVEALRIPRTDNQGMLPITASLGVASANEGDKDTLIGDADAALYEAKRQGKNRTVRAPVEAANVLGAEYPRAPRLKAPAGRRSQ